MPCKNAADCVPRIDSSGLFDCICIDGFAGKFCDKSRLYYLKYIIEECVVILENVLTHITHLRMTMRLHRFSLILGPYNFQS